MSIGSFRTLVMCAAITVAACAPTEDNAMDDTPGEVAAALTPIDALNAFYYATGEILEKTGVELVEEAGGEEG